AIWSSGPSQPGARPAHEAGSAGGAAAESPALAGTSSVKWQAAAWLGDMSWAAGSSAAHPSRAPSRLPNQHPVWNRHPAGGDAGLGGSPGSTMRSLRASTAGSGTGAADSKDTVYGCLGSL